MMNYHDITKDDMKNGDGLRVVLWVSGCEHHCKGCQNPVTWNENDGLRFGVRERKEIYKELKRSIYTESRSAVEIRYTGIIKGLWRCFVKT